jgi:two-component system, sensor histidine kinase and response regulator
METRDADTSPTELFDFDGALKRFGGDRELCHDLIRFFLEDTPGLLEQVRTGLETGNQRTTVHGAHTLKGLAANFAAVEARDVAQEIEVAAGSGGMDRAVELLPRLERDFARLQAALRDFQEANPL